MRRRFSPDVNRPFISDADAVEVEIGAVLSQVADGNDQQIAYFSKVERIKEN